MDFKISENVSALGIKVVFLVIYNIDNTPVDELLKKKIGDFHKNSLRSFTTENLESDPNIIGYRKLHEKVGVTEKSLVASPESLIKLLFKHKTLRPISFIVDTYNYVAIKNRVSIGAHDVEQINGNVRLCLANGDERFIPLGKKSLQAINKGEYCYIDDANEIICRLDCRQCDKTKTTVKTKSCLFIIQGHADIPEKILLSTAEEIQSLILMHTTKNAKTILKLI